MVELEEDLTVLDEDITGLEEDLTELDEDVDFLFDEQIIQDERLLNLEQENDVIDDELESEILLQYICLLDIKNQLFDYFLCLCRFTGLNNIFGFPGYNFGGE